MTKKIISLIMLTVLGSGIAFAQFSISGSVKDKVSGEAIIGAVISMENTFVSMQSDAKGAFEIKNVKAGKHVVNVQFLGYVKQSFEMEISENKVLQIDLEPNTIMADEFIVSSTRANSKSPTTYSSISKEEIAKQNLGQDLPYLLNLTPSVVVTSDAGAGVGYTGIRVRGSDATRVNVTVNGIPLNDSESHGVFWVNMPDFASGVENIQLQRGVGTSTNGAAAFGASLNMQTNSLQENAYGEISNSYGSFNTLKHTLKFGTGLLDGKWTIDGRLSKISSDGYVDRAASDLTSYFMSASYYSTKSVLKLNVFSGKERTYQAWWGVPEKALDTNRTYNYYTYANETDNYKQDHYQLLHSYSINKSFNLNTALHYTKGKGYYEQFRPNEDLRFYSIEPPVIGNDTINTSNIIRRRWLDNDFYGGTYSLNYNPNNKLNASIGGAYNQYTGRHFGEVIWAEYAGNSFINHKYYDNDAQKNDFNTYLKVNYQVLEKLNLYGDFQYRSIMYSFLGFNSLLENVQQKVNHTFLNPKAGLIYELSSKTNFYASFAIGNREPTRDDYTQSTPESRPKAEHLKNIEAGMKYNNKKVFLNANVFHMDYTNQLILTGAINDVGAYVRTNVKDSYRAGLELEGGIQPVKRVRWNANVTLSQNKIKQLDEYIDDYDLGGQQLNQYKNTDIAFSPSVIAASEINVSILKSLSFAFQSKYVGKQYLDNTSNSNRMLKAYLLHNARLIYVLKPKFIKEINISILANNILNTLYESNGYTFSYIYGGSTTTENYYYPQSGFNFLTALTLKF